MILKKGRRYHLPLAEGALSLMPPSTPREGRTLPASRFGNAEGGKHLFERDAVGLCGFPDRLVICDGTAKATHSESEEYLCRFWLLPKEVRDCTVRIQCHIPDVVPATIYTLKERARITPDSASDCKTAHPAASAGDGATLPRRMPRHRAGPTHPGITAARMPRSRRVGRTPRSSQACDPGFHFHPARPSLNTVLMSTTDWRCMYEPIRGNRENLPET